jgi:TonB family protein
MEDGLARELDETYRVGGDVTRPERIAGPSLDLSRFDPEVFARGAPIVEAVITPAGVVESVRVLKSAHPVLEDHFVTTIKQWRFRPATRAGKPVAVYYTITSTVYPR